MANRHGWGEAPRGGSSDPRRGHTREPRSRGPDEWDSDAGGAYGRRAFGDVGDDTPGTRVRARGGAWDPRQYGSAPDERDEFRRFDTEPGAYGAYADDDVYASDLPAGVREDRFRSGGGGYGPDPRSVPFRERAGNVRSAAYARPGYGTSPGLGERWDAEDDYDSYVPYEYAGGRGLGYGGDAMGDSFIGGARQLDRGPERAYGSYRTETYGSRSYGRHRGRGPRGYRRSDERLLEDIHERLTDDPDLDASDIEVQCSDGEITLAGRVDERWMKHRAEDIVDACLGVREIHNRIRVGEPAPESIAAAGDTATRAADESPTTAGSRATQRRNH